MISEFVSLPLSLEVNSYDDESADMLMFTGQGQTPPAGSKNGVERVMEFAPGDPIRAMERASIRAYVELHRDKLRGRVLDYGCGEQPYRDLVEGEYVGMDRMGERERYILLTGLPFDSILCTQVLEYIPLTDQQAAMEPSPIERLMDEFYSVLKPGGFLVCTYPTCWDEVEDTDLVRYTKAGIESLFKQWYGWKILDHTRRAEVCIGDFTFPLGYGLLAQRI